MNRRILFVDDEQNVLSAISRQLRKNFDIHVAQSGKEGLLKLEQNDPFSVVISDMRMPEMDGIEFLKQVAVRSPNSVRMMLTGNSDQQTAIDAVNEGKIFRFLGKPSTPEVLVNNLEAGIRQHELIVAERELLEKTLKGSIAALMDILAIANPAAFSRAQRIRHYTADVIHALNLPESWKFEVAAMLSQIGFVTIPEETVEKHMAGEPLTPEEEEMLLDQRKDACLMLEKIPRLEQVRGMIDQMENAAEEARDSTDIVKFGGHLLHTIIEFDNHVSRGASAGRAVSDLILSGKAYRKDILDALRDVSLPQIEQTVAMIPIKELRLGMVLAEDIRHNVSNALIISKGQTVNALTRKRLRNFYAQKTICGEVRIHDTRQIFLT
ncbi:MAG: response regulator [Pontiellaceae bacterium]|nr:response regulator [Pontiellaceae bacterium]